MWYLKKTHGWHNYNLGSRLFFFILCCHQFWDNSSDQWRDFFKFEFNFRIRAFCFCSHLSQILWKEVDRNHLLHYLVHHCYQKRKMRGLNLQWKGEQLNIKKMQSWTCLKMGPELSVLTKSCPRLFLIFFTAFTFNRRRRRDPKPKESPAAKLVLPKVPSVKKTPSSSSGER